MLIEALSGHVFEPRFPFRRAGVLPRARAMPRVGQRISKHEFQRQHPCPSTGRTTGACPGFVKDHVIPLACGGPDSVANLQWQTIAAAKAKD
jgi:hypothetical protein